MDTQKHDIKHLNELIETTLDSAEGYAEAAKESKKPQFTELFSNRAAERKRVASSLQAQVSQLGGDPKDSGTVLASAHRIFVNLRSKLSSGDTAVVDEVERGEDHIKAKFEDALKDTELSPHTRAVIQEAYASVKAGHDQMRDIKQQLHRES